MHEGHRQRLLRRLETDAASMQDHELLEALLFNAIPRKDTNETAHLLLQTFGTVEGVFQASVGQLMQVHGIGAETAAYLRNLAILSERVRYSGTKYPKQFNIASYTEFLCERFRGLRNEVVEVFCLDCNERIKSTKRFTLDNRTRVTVPMNEVSYFISANRPHGVVVAHNHPESASAPSSEDEDFTAQFAMLCSVNNTKFFDHIIVGQDGVYSYFRAGRMEEFRRTYNMTNMLQEKTRK